jgi:hypothetical protein
MHKIIYLILITAAVAFPGIHNNMRTTQVHSPFRWVFADSAARVAESVTASDTDKVAYQKSDSSLWVLRDNDPKTWIELNNHIGSFDVDSVDTRVVNADSMIFGTAGYVKCDTGSFACTLAVAGGSGTASGDTVGTGRYFKIGNFISVVLTDISCTFTGVLRAVVNNYPEDLSPYSTPNSYTSTPTLSGECAPVIIGYDGVKCAIIGSWATSFSIKNICFSYYIYDD